MFEKSKFFMHIDARELSLPHNFCLIIDTPSYIILALVDTHQTAASGFGFNHITV